MKKIFTFSFAAILFAYSLFGQEKRSIGLSGSLQSNQLGISLPIWVTKNVVIAPVFQIASAQNIGTDFAIGIVPRYYFKTEKVSPYIGLKAGIANFNPSSKNLIDKSSKDIIVGLAGGAEYFFTEKFSMGVEAQLNFTKSGIDSYRFGNPDGMNFNTATMISATVYF